MELRVRVGVGKLGVEDARASALLDHLVHEAGSLGPVLSWEKGEAIVTLACDRRHEASAARNAASTVSDALEHVGLEDHFASVLEVERV